MRTDMYIAKAVLVSMFYSAALFGQSAHAQDNNPIKTCQAESANESEEITCLRNVVRALLNSPAQRAETALVPPGPLASPEPQAPVAADTPTVTADTSRKPEETVAAPARKDAPTSPVAAPTGIGAEQVVAKQEKQERKTKAGRKKQVKKNQESSYVLDFAYTSSGQLILVLGNGQVWAQRKGDNQDVRLTDQEKTPVIIRRGAISGYRIDFTDKRRTIIAERLK